MEQQQEGQPQGSPLSSLLSNIIPSELDGELERRGFRFVRDADDANIFVDSEKAARRVLENMSGFIEKKHLLRKLRSRGMRYGTAYREVHTTNNGRWRLAHTMSDNQAWSTHWFNDQDLLTFSEEQRPHGQDRSVLHFCEEPCADPHARFCGRTVPRPPTRSRDESAWAGITLRAGQGCSGDGFREIQRT